MKTVLVTGASSGIGRATALEFARKGYRVAGVARRKELLATLLSEMQAAGPRAEHFVLECDVSKWSSVEAMVKTVEDKFGSLDILINNAGAYDFAPLEKVKVEKIDEIIDVNVKGVVYVTKACLGIMKKAATESGQSKMVHVSSIAGLWGFSNMAVYSASKFAVEGLVKSLRRELKKDNIEVAVISPGPVNTRLPKGERPKKSTTKLPEDIALQILDLCRDGRTTSHSHPVFHALQYLEPVSANAVDRILKKVL